MNVHEYLQVVRAHDSADPGFQLWSEQPLKDHLDDTRATETTVHAELIAVGD
jgi:hypothetical protein